MFLSAWQLLQHTKRSYLPHMRFEFEGEEARKMHRSTLQRRSKSRVSRRKWAVFVGTSVPYLHSKLILRKGTFHWVVCRGRAREIQENLRSQQGRCKQQERNPLHRTVPWLTRRCALRAGRTDLETVGIRKSHSIFAPEHCGRSTVVRNYGCWE